MKKILKFLKKLFTKKTIVRTTPSGGGTNDVIDSKYTTKDENIK
jgi:hypothetical protein